MQKLAEDYFWMWPVMIMLIIINNVLFLSEHASTRPILWECSNLQRMTGLAASVTCPPRVCHMSVHPSVLLCRGGCLESRLLVKGDNSCMNRLWQALTLKQVLQQCLLPGRPNSNTRMHYGRIHASYIMRRSNFIEEGICVFIASTPGSVPCDYSYWSSTFWTFP